MFLSRPELEGIGFRSCGDQVYVDARAWIYERGRIGVGSYVRIDAGALLSPARGSIEIGSHVHISSGVQLYGGGTIRVEDFACISARATILSLTDDFPGPFLCGPMVPDEVRNVIAAPVSCGPYSVIGSGSVVLPGVTVGRGAAVGAMSLVTEDVPPGAVMAGTPARKIGSRDLGELERRAQEVLDRRAEGERVVPPPMPP